MERKIRETTRQVMAVVLAVAMCFAFLPSTVLAEGDEDSVDENYDIEITEEATGEDEAIADEETTETGESTETEESEETDPSQSEEEAAVEEEQETDDNGIMLLASNGTCGDNLTWNLDDDGVLTISGSGAMDDYTANSGTPWYDDYDSIISVVVEDGVTSVGSYAFYQCPNLISVSFGNDVETIGNYAFDGSTSLQKVTFGSDSKLTEIGLYAFYQCSGISEAIELPDSLQTIRNYAFTSCTSLPSITFGSSLTSIGNYAFRYCSGISSELVFPDSLESIGTRAFDDCTSVTGITFGSGLTSIANYAFERCISTNYDNAAKTTTEVEAGAEVAEGLNGTPEEIEESRSFEGVTVTIPDSVTSMGTNVFLESYIDIFVFGSNITSVDVSTVYNSYELDALIFNSKSDDVTISGADSTNLHFNADDVTVAYTGNVSEIASGVCGDDLTWVLKGNGVLTISGTGDMYDYPSGRAPWYEYRDSIMSVVVEDGATSIGNYAFYDCENMTSVTFSSEITTIGQYAFYHCYELSGELEFPDTLESIGNNAFMGDAKLTGSLVFPDALESIGSQAFYHCNNIASVTFGSGLKSIGDSAFRECMQCEDCASTIEFPDGLETIGIFAFADCDLGKYATDADKVTTEVEAGNKLATGVTGEPETLTQSVSFTGVTIKLPDSVSSVGRSAFYDTYVDVFIFGDHLTTVDVSAFNSYEADAVIFSNSYEDVTITDTNKATYKFDDSQLSVVYGAEDDDIVSYNESNPFCGMTLQEAVYAVADGSMASPIIIEKNIQLSSTLIVPDNFAGTITAEKTSGYWIRCKEDEDINPMITVAVGADLTFDGHVELSGVNTVTIIENEGAVTLAGNVTVIDGDIEETRNSIIHVTGSSASLTISDSACIKNHSINNSYSAAVLADDGAEIIMNGGSVENNEMRNSYTAAIMVADGASFTLKDGTVNDNTYSDMESGAILAREENSTIIINGGSITNNKDVENEARGDYTSYNAPVVITDEASISFNDGTISDNNAHGKHSSSGILLYDGGSGEMTGGTIENNTSVQKGSAILLYSTKKASDVYSNNFTMSGGVIRGNKQTERSVSISSDGANIISQYGGTVYVADNSSFKMTGGEITGNNARSGGGVAVVDTFSSSNLEGTYKTEFILDGGTISDNTAVTGGGIYSYSNGTELISGYITNNHAADPESHQSYLRGGGVYSEGTQSSGYSTVHMYNVMITDNTAGEIGGGIWLCATGTADIYVTNGGTITNNSARGRYSYDPDYGAGDDLAFGNGYGSTLRLAARILGGGKVDWYKDGTILVPGGSLMPEIDPFNEERYDPDNPGEPYEPEVTYSECIASKAIVDEEEAIEYAKAQTKLYITGNDALDYGGGVAANGGVTIGEDEDLLEISGTKVWDDNDNASGARPDSITVYLKVRTSEGESYTLESMEVEPDEDGNWNWTFSDLPRVDANGNQLVYSYYIEEEDVDRYISDTITDMNGDYVITNKLVEPKITKEEFEDDYSRKDEDIEHDDGNGHFEENIEGDGWGSWDDADNNQEINYRITLTDIKGVTNVTVHDYLEDGLDFIGYDDTEDVDIWLYDTDVSGYVIGTHLEEGVDFTWSNTGCTDPNGCAMGGCTFEVKFADEDFEGISEAAYIVIEYKAKTDTHADDYDDYEDDILNHSYMTYGTNSYRSGIITTETDLFGFGVYKYADEDGEVVELAGAKFILSEQGTREDGTTGTRYATFVRETDSYNVDYYLVSGWVDNFADAGILISGDDGMIRIEGLDDDSYILTEIEAPVGYEMLKEPDIEVVINEYGEVTFNGNDEGVKENGTLTQVDVQNELTLIDIEVEKEWDDSDNQDGERPDEIMVRLYANGKPAVDENGDEIVVTIKPDEDGNWPSYWFTDLPEYENGEKITYTVIENLITDYTPEYEQEETDREDREDGGQNDLITWTITNKHTPDETGLSVFKMWTDAEDQDGKRPESIKIHLLADGEPVLDEDGEEITAELTAEDGWYWSISGLPKYKQVEDDEGEVTTHEIVYTITEDDVKDYKANIVQVDGTTAIIIDNIHTPDTVDVEGSKTWEDNGNEDGTRPDYITIRLYADGEEIAHVNVTADDDWSWSFTDLPKYETILDDEGNVIDHQEIEYSITEDAVEGYESAVDGYDVTNSHTPEQPVPEAVNISGIKVWDDNSNSDGSRPDSITVNLLANGKEIDSVTITEDDDWAWSFDGLAKCDEDGNEIEYTIEEDAVNDYNDPVIREIVDNAYVIINSHTPEEPVPETTYVFGIKVWDDENDADNIRPESITVNLLADGELVDSKKVTAATNWLWSFTGLDKYDEEGNEIVYSVAEVEVNGYGEPIISGDQENGFTITNSHTPGEVPETIDISGMKIWEDDDNADGSRQNSITVRLFAGDTEVDSREVSADDNWAWRFSGLDKYDADGNEITYTVTEDEVEGYDTAIDQILDTDTYIITNTHTTEEETPETVNVSGVKVWDDKGNADGIRPDSITVNLLANGEKVDSMEVIEDTYWIWSFNDLDKYDEEGNEIEYTVDEDDVKNYTSEITGDQDNGYKITNTHTPKESTTGTPTSGRNGGSTPKTGDTNHLGAWIALLMACAVIVGDLIYMRRRASRVSRRNSRRRK